MSLFRIPSGVADRVEKLMRDFLWEGVEEGKRCHMVRWEVVAEPMTSGGLGIGSLKVTNAALLTKWLWRFHLEPTALWQDVIKSIYGRNEHGWDAKVANGRSSQCPWKDISGCFGSFLEGFAFVVGDGMRVRFWEDDWMRGGVLKEVFPRLFAVSRKQNSAISSFTDIQTFPHSWDFGFRRNLNEEEVEEVVRLLDALNGVRLYPARPDRRRWNLDRSGSFSVHSLRVLGGRADSREAFPPFPGIWKAKTPPKVKVFAWLVVLGKVNTCDVLQKFRPVTYLCPHQCILCKQEGESVDHLFIHCPFTLQLWWKALGEGRAVWVVPKYCFQLFSTNLDALGKGKKARILWGCLMQAVISNVWMEQNRRIFEVYEGVGVAEV